MQRQWLSKKTFLFFSFSAVPSVHGSSWAKDRIWATAAAMLDFEPTVLGRGLNLCCHRHHHILNPLHRSGDSGNISLKPSTARRHCYFLSFKRSRSRGKVSPPTRSPGKRAANSSVLSAPRQALTNLSGLLIWTGWLPQLCLFMIPNSYFLLTNQTDGQPESRGRVPH